MSVLTPVLVPIPFESAETPADRARRNRRYARVALRECAIRCGAPLDGWLQNAEGVPQPQGRWRWSLSHTRGLAAAVIADHPVGIDVEYLRPRNPDLWSEIASDPERRLLSDASILSFYRLWTAKEAVLKAQGVGLAGLNQCRIVEVPDPNHLIIAFKDRPYCVEHFRTHDHLSAVTCGAEPACWQVLPIQYDTKYSPVTSSTDKNDCRSITKQ